MTDFSWFREWLKAAKRRRTYNRYSDSIPYVFEGHWCKGTWDNYLKGYYDGSEIKFCSK